MSTNPDCHTLADYVRALVGLLDAVDPAAGWRLRRIVGRRWARLQLDDESVVVGIRDGQLVVLADDDMVVDGIGMTDRQTVLDILDGTVEVSTTLLDGRMRAQGRIDAMAAMFSAIEILLDAATRSPAMQQLATVFRFDPCRPPPRRNRAGAARRWRTVDTAELALLASLDLLPDADDALAVPEVAVWDD